MSEARIQQLQSFLESDPDDTFTRFALALEYLKAGNTDQADTLFTNIKRDEPSYTGVYYHLGKLRESQNRRDDAIRIYSEGIVICRQAGDLHALSELQQALDELIDQESS